ncbi:MAG: hypothetical protein IPM45_02250 [Acidimicrobiales bacterium]|nr:hypothetical protein [Acidimicrobiales bacterium]
MSTGERPRRWRWVVLAVLGAALLAGAVLVLLVVRGRDARRVSVDEAVDRYRASTTIGGPALGRPAQGVYTLTGSGSEKLSFQTTGQTIGPTLTATVTWRGDSCWDLRIDYNANHWQTWRYCIEGDHVVDEGGAVFQRIDLVVAHPESLSISACEPPVPSLRRGATAGTTWDDTCTVVTDGRGRSELIGTVTFLGDEAVTVAGEEVSAGHNRYERRYSGAQRGHGVLDTWFATDTGLPLRSRWELQITSGSPIGDVTYTESGEWTLDSLTPRQ